MESFFRSLKAERVYLTRYASYQEAKSDLFDYIRFYNHRRRHSTLGYLSPMEFERQGLRAKASRNGQLGGKVILLYALPSPGHHPLRHPSV